MKEDLIKLKVLLSRVKPWVAVAVVLATLFRGLLWHPWRAVF